MSFPRVVSGNPLDSCLMHAGMTTKMEVNDAKSFP